MSSRAALQAIRDRGQRQAVIRTMQENAGPSYDIRAGGAGSEIPWVSTTMAGVRCWFGGEGLRVGSGASSGQGWGLRLSRVGRGNKGAGLVSEAAARVAGNRVTYQRNANGMTVQEWFLNGPLGLEHGFTLPAPPPQRQAGELVLEIVVEGEA